MKNIDEFYWNVTSKIRPPNHEFSLYFVKALVCEVKGIELNWAEFGAHLHQFRSQIQEEKRCNNRKKQAFTSTSDFSMLESTFPPPQPLRSYVLNLSSSLSNEPSFIAQGQTNLCKVDLCGIIVKKEDITP